MQRKTSPHSWIHFVCLFVFFWGGGGLAWRNGWLPLRLSPSLPAACFLLTMWILSVSLFVRFSDTLLHLRVMRSDSGTRVSSPLLWNSIQMMKLSWRCFAGSRWDAGVFVAVCQAEGNLSDERCCHCTSLAQTVSQKEKWCCTICVCRIKKYLLNLRW